MPLHRYQERLILSLQPYHIIDLVSQLQLCVSYRHMTYRQGADIDYSVITWTYKSRLFAPSEAAL